MSLYAGTTTYVYQACGKSFDSLGAAQAELSRVLGYTVTDVNTYDVTTMDDGAAGREVYIVWADPAQLPHDDTQGID
jgi:hypothetical protein